MTETQKHQFARFLSDECAALLTEHLQAAEQAAAESDPDGDKPVKAKIGVRFEWHAGSATPNVKTTLAYTTSHKDETERVFDPDQVKIDFEGGAE